MALVVLNNNLEGLQTNRLIGLENDGLSEVDCWRQCLCLKYNALGETNGGLWLMRCGGVGCLERQPGRAIGESHYNPGGLQINCRDWPEVLVWWQSVLY